MAAWLFEHLLDGADAYVDLHSGGIDQHLLDFAAYRLTSDTELDAKNRAMAQTGQLGDRESATVRRLLDALYRILHHLGVIEASEHVRPATAQPREWIWTGDVVSEITGLWYPDAVTGDEVTEGQTIGRIIDPVDGAEHKVTATATGKILYGMNGLSVRPGTELAALVTPHD